MSKIAKLITCLGITGLICLPGSTFSHTTFAAEPCPPDREACQSQPTDTPTEEVDSSQVGKLGNVAPKFGTDPNCQNPSSDNSINCVKQQTFVTGVVQPVVNVLSALVGVVVVGALIVGGLQYITAGDKPDAVAAARKRITQALIALLMFFLLFAFVQYLIPGGIF